MRSSPSYGPVAWVAVALFALAGAPVPAAQGTHSVFLEDLTTAELSTWTHGRAGTVLVYGGGVEETGPHIVLGKHNVRVRRYAQEIARELGGTLVAPIIPFAPNGSALRAFPGTLSLEESTFSAVYEEVARSLASAGFRRIVFLSDHFNSQQPLKDLAARLDAEFAAQGVRVFFCGDVYAKAREVIEKEVADSGHVPGGHGGYWDTAEMLAVAPAAVRTQLIAAGSLEDDGNGALDAKGISGDPRGATAVVGQHFADIRIRLAVAQIRGFLRDAGSAASGEAAQQRGNAPAAAITR